MLNFILNESTYEKTNYFYENYVVIDFETTGFYPTNDEIIQIGAIKYEEDTAIDEFSTLIKPKEATISSKISELTGITEVSVLDAPYIDYVLTELVEFINGLPIVAHNADFDMSFLIHSLNKNKIDGEHFQVVDTLLLSRESIKNVPNHKLETLKSYLHLPYGSHDAIEDVKTTAALYQYIKKM